MRPPLILLGVFATASAVLAEPASADLKALLEQLGAPAFEAREAAQRQILALPEDAEVALLEALAGAADPEVKERLTKAVWDRRGHRAARQLKCDPAEVDWVEGSGPVTCALFFQKQYGLLEPIDVFIYLRNDTQASVALGWSRVDSKSGFQAPNGGRQSGHAGADDEGETGGIGRIELAPGKEGFFPVMHFARRLALAGALSHFLLPFSDPAKADGQGTQYVFEDIAFLNLYKSERLGIKDLQMRFPGFTLNLSALPEGRRAELAGRIAAELKDPPPSFYLLVSRKDLTGSQRILRGLDAIACETRYALGRDLLSLEQVMEVLRANPRLPQAWELLGKLSARPETVRFALGRLAEGDSKAAEFMVDADWKEVERQINPLLGFGQPWSQYLKKAELKRLKPFLADRAAFLEALTAGAAAWDRKIDEAAKNGLAEAHLSCLAFARLAVLAQVEDRSLAALFRRWTRRLRDPGVKGIYAVPLLDLVETLRDKAMVPDVVARLEDRETIPMFGLGQGDPMRTCDKAGILLYKLLGMDPKEDFEAGVTRGNLDLHPVERRDRGIEKLKAWWVAHKGEYPE